ncbi:hypothetical protein K505DRAFT_337598 [Melanomma pulvis-pyrius CBS 109.77]|uniref:Uncharacterized protein n=1 Tax=Melanomma pulvis-pyrius CBS 109.77 TaxID=1314802 RepID=A0A6A6XD70_9PLEO|nr:hypothetical protein K505DRAFT_337598 [Melanomma pulvis-pyrius CBS 109.77]
MPDHLTSPTPILENVSPLQLFLLVFSIATLIHQYLAITRLQRAAPRPAFFPAPSQLPNRPLNAISQPPVFIPRYIHRDRGGFFGPRLPFRQAPHDNHYEYEGRDWRDEREAEQERLWFRDLQMQMQGGPAREEARFGAGFQRGARPGGEARGGRGERRRN